MSVGSISLYSCLIWVNNTWLYSQFESNYKSSFRVLDKLKLFLHCWMIKTSLFRGSMNLVNSILSFFSSFCFLDLWLHSFIFWFFSHFNRDRTRQNQTISHLECHHHPSIFILLFICFILYIYKIQCFLTFVWTIVDMRILFFLLFICGFCNE